MEIFKECPNPEVCRVVVEQPANQLTVEELSKKIPDIRTQVSNNLLAIGNCDFENGGRCVMLAKGRGVTFDCGLSSFRMPREYSESTSIFLEEPQPEQ